MHSTAHSSRRLATHGGPDTSLNTVVVSPASPYDATVSAFLASDASGKRPIAIFARDAASGELVGAIEGDVLACAYGVVGRLAVAPRARRGGVGKALLAAFEAAAAALPLPTRDGAASGAHTISLFTFDFQAPLYYPRIGFRLVDVVPKWGARTVHVFAKPALPREAAAAASAAAAAAARVSVSLARAEEDDELESFLRSTFEEHSMGAVGRGADYTPLAIVAREGEGGAIVGVARGAVFFEGLSVYDLFVTARARGRGVGGRLLRALLDAGARAGAVLATAEAAAADAPRVLLREGFVEHPAVPPPAGAPAGAPPLRTLRRALAPP